MTEHNHKAGDHVTVHNETLGGRAIVEGKAVIATLLDDNHQYEVRFDGEPDETYERFVA